MAPCLLGYGAVASMLSRHVDTKREGNQYWPWIENYVAEDYTTAVRLGSGKFYFICPVFMLINCSELLEENMRKQSPARIEELVKIFIHATKVGSHSLRSNMAFTHNIQMEIGFWDMHPAR